MIYSDDLKNSQKEEERQVNAVFVIICILFLLGFFSTVVLSSVGTVDAGHRGVKTRFNAVTGEVLNEGFYFKIPFIEGVKKVDVRVQKREADAASASSDLQTVTTTVAVNYHVNPSAVAQLYQNIGVEYRERLIEPAIEEAVKGSTAEFTAEELITKRSSVKEGVKAKLSEPLSKHGIIVDEINIVNFKFSESFDKAIEAKVTAEQDALAAKNKLEQIKFEASQAVEGAKGKAEALRIESEALRQNPEVLELRKLEKWDGQLPKVVGDVNPFVALD